MNHEMMWKELKEKIPNLIDEDGLIILTHLEELIEELEVEWASVIGFKSR